MSCTNNKRTSFDLGSGSGPGKPRRIDQPPDKAKPPCLSAEGLATSRLLLESVEGQHVSELDQCLVSLRISHLELVPVID